MRFFLKVLGWDKLYYIWFIWSNLHIKIHSFCQSNRNLVLWLHNALLFQQEASIILVFATFALVVAPRCSVLGIKIQCDNYHQCCMQYNNTHQLIFNVSSHTLLAIFGLCGSHRLFWYKAIATTIAAIEPRAPVKCSWLTRLLLFFYNVHR